VIALVAACFFILFAALALCDDRAGTQDSRVSIEPRVQRRGTMDRTSPNIRVNSNLVLIPVTVTDDNNRFVKGLEKEHFNLYEDKVEQLISHFASEDVPISVGIVFDCSGSMGNKLGKSREAVAQFLRISNPDDEFLLVTFANSAELLVPLTTDSSEIQNRLTFTQSKGETALLDAIYLAMHEMKHARHSRKALIVISDGGDNSSRYTFGELRRMVREADIQIHAIGILEPIFARGRAPEELTGPALLGDIAEETGGLSFDVENLDDLPAIASKIGVALRNQYILGYSPTKLHNDGKYHRVQVKLMNQKGLPGLRLSWRHGYHAPLQ
jgi:VWFA-related protein